MLLTWLRNHALQWQEQAQQGRLPHALLVSGMAGVGKRAFAAWLAAGRFGAQGAESGPSYGGQPPSHPDLHWVRPLPDKLSIGVDQVRELVGELALTSYSGGAKMAVIEPANVMTHSAANSLLKTLEEPSGDALLVLISDRMGGLPATILSRCQRLAIAPPATSAAIGWLQEVRGEGDWGPLLELAGGAPLAALEAHDRLEESLAMQAELNRVAAGKESPIDVAARWAKLEIPFVLDWLTRCVQRMIRRSFGTDPSAAGLADSVLRRIDRRNLFCYLDMIVGLRNQPAGSFNAQLALESLLIDWANGLRQCRSGHRSDEKLPLSR